jgi:hypothetical protein
MTPRVSCTRAATVQYRPRANATAPRPRLCSVGVIILWGMGFLISSGGASAQEMTVFSRNGSLSWTNGLTNGVYEVQWSSSLTAGEPWTNDWSQLQGIQGTQSVFTVPVPMFYRVKGNAYPEVTDSAECYARYSNALKNAAVALPEEISTGCGPWPPTRRELIGAHSPTGWMAAHIGGFASRP